jgi:uncharacterized protein YjbI with pentapeptide repeats
MATPILYRVGFVTTGGVTITNENQSLYPHHINKSYEEIQGFIMQEVNAHRTVDLSGALIGGTDLTWISLRGVNFTGADLRGAQFCGSDFAGAILTDATYDWISSFSACSGLGFWFGSSW